DVIGDQNRADAIEVQAPVLFRNIDSGKAEIGGLAQQADHDAGLLGFDCLDDRLNFLTTKSGGCSRDLQLLLVQIFMREDLSGRAVLNQKTAAARSYDGGFRVYAHAGTTFNQHSTAMGCNWANRSGVWPNGCMRDGHRPPSVFCVTTE